MTTDIPGRREASDSNGAQATRPLTEELRRGREELRAIGSETGDLAAELQELARREAQLVRAELQDNMELVRTGAMFGAAAAVLALFALGFASLAAVYALTLVLPAWAAALIVAGAWLLIGAIAGWMARDRFSKFSPMPQRSIRSIQEDTRWAREQMKRNGV